MEKSLQVGYLNGFLEVLGKTILHDTLSDCKRAEILQDGQICVSDALPPSFFLDMDNLLRAEYGMLGSRGIAYVAGKIAFKYYKDSVDIFVERGKIENRLLPFGEKISMVLQEFFAKLKQIEVADLIPIRNAQENSWVVQGLGLPKGNMFQTGDQYFLIGVLVSMLEWLDSRHSFRVQQNGTAAAIQTGKVELYLKVKRFE